MNIRSKINSYLSGVNEKELQDIERVVKTIIHESLQRACRKTYDGGADKEVLLKVFNEMMRDIKT